MKAKLREEQRKGRKGASVILSKGPYEEPCLQGLQNTNRVEVISVLGGTSSQRTGPAAEKVCFQALIVSLFN